MKAFDAFFSKLSSTDLHYINDQKITHSFRKGELIFKEGRKPSGIYCISEGSVKIFKLGTDGRELITRLAFKGEFIGLKALLTDTYYSVSAETLDDSVICFINKTDFFHLTLRYPEFNRSLIACLSQQLTDAETKMITLAQKTVRERLAGCLVYLFSQLSGLKEPVVPNYINITRQDLGNMIGATHETVIRLLKEFREAGTIQIKGRKIFVVDMDQLFKISQGLYQ
jgi:CRP-like cAMP-binding protein